MWFKKKKEKSQEWGQFTSWDFKENVLKVFFENYKPLTKLQVLEKVFVFLW